MTILAERASDPASFETKSGRWLLRPIRWAKSGVITLTDQGLISGTNFALSIILARYLDPAAYGMFGIAFSAYLLAIVIQDALLLEPLTVFASSRSSRGRRYYVGILLRWHLFIAAPILLIGALIWHRVAFQASDMGLSACLLAAAMATPCLLVFWLLRRALYLGSPPLIGPAIALLYSASVLLGLRIVIRYWTLTPVTPFILMAGAAAVCATILAFFVQPKTRQPRCDLSIARKHWTYGRWALASQVLTWAPPSLFIWVAGAWYGMYKAGELKAVFNFLQPFQQILTALQLALLPSAVRTFSRYRWSGLRRAIIWITILFITLALCYWVPITLADHRILGILYGPKYSQTAAYLPLLALASTASAAAWAAVIGLRAAQLPSRVSLIYFVMNGVAIIIGLPWLWYAGLYGIAAALTISAAASVPIAFLLVARLSRQITTPTPLISEELRMGM